MLTHRELITDFVAAIKSEVLPNVESDEIKSLIFHSGNPAGEPIPGHGYVDILEADGTADTYSPKVSFLAQAHEGVTHDMVNDFIDKITAWVYSRGRGIPGIMSIKTDKFDRGENFPILIYIVFGLDFKLTQKDYLL